MQLLPDYESGMRSSLAGGADFVVEDVEPGRVAVSPREGAGAVRQYFRLSKVADANTDIVQDDPWAFLAVMPPASKPEGFGIPEKMRDQWERLHQSDTLAALTQRLGVEVAITEVERLPHLFRRELPALFERYPGGSLWYVGVEEVLLKRLTAMKIALQSSIAPDSKFAEGREGITYFGAFQLTGGLSFVEVVAPLLLTFSPAVAGFAMDALPGAFVFFFGQFDNDHDLRRSARDDLSISYHPAVNQHPTAPGVKVPVKGLGAGELGALLGWWLRRLDILYSHAADPTRFVAGDGSLDSNAQAAWYFTVERLLADFTALGAAVTAPPLLRMQGAFDALDKASSLIAGAGGNDATEFMRLLSAKATLPCVERAFDLMPAQSRSRFKRWARDSYARLYSDIRGQTLQDRITPDGKAVLVAWDRPTDLRRMSWDEYVGALVREARNASHGLMNILTHTPKNKRAHRFLLATNQGDVPASLYEVARVICLALIADAQSLRLGQWRQRQE